ncbi:MAG TPA: alpha/beta hydrolase [Solirubrobacteraceae bacterium]|nr:alpha/beta hydrolase [Solirubrobacteraceae bacterium]
MHAKRIDVLLNAADQTCSPGQRRRPVLAGKDVIVIGLVGEQLREWAPGNGHRALLRGGGMRRARADWGRLLDDDLRHRPGLLVAFADQLRRPAPKVRLDRQQEVSSRIDRPLPLGARDVHDPPEAIDNRFDGAGHAPLLAPATDRVGVAIEQHGQRPAVKRARQLVELERWGGARRAGRRERPDGGLASGRLVSVPQVATPAGVMLEYDTFGSSADPALLLVMGFSSQMIAWPRAFCQRLAAAGRFVIRFDNRDCGLSSKFDGQVAALGAVMAAASAGDLEGARARVPYTLSAMSDDALALLSALGIERAHVVGASMGGMIAQNMAIEHPERVLTLTSMMSTTGEPEFGRSTPEAMEALLAPAPAGREAYIEAAEKLLIWRSRRYPDLAGARALAAESYDRCYYPEGAARQMAAMIVAGSRADGLRSLRVPTLVIHGLDDTLVAPSGGERTAELVEGARLLLLEDMGHDRPVQLWPQLCGAILEHTA